MGAPDPKIAETRVKVCSKHGPYEQRRANPQAGLMFWVGACKPCEIEREEEQQRERRVQAIREHYRHAQIPQRFMTKMLANYTPQTKLQAEALAVCKELAEDPRSAALIGPPGVGKTHLAIGILHAAINSPYLWVVRYTTQPDFLAAIQGNWAWNGETDAAKQFAQVPLLVLDEVWHPVNERDRESITALIDARYREECPTIICSNLTWPQLREALGERACDRLLEDGPKAIPLDGQSMRKKGGVA